MSIALGFVLGNPAAEYDLYLLAGQSNMDGYGMVAELPEELAGPVEGAVIYNANTAADGAATPKAAAWAPLRPGHGMGSWSVVGAEGLSERFGPELTFARRMRELRPGRKVAIVKYARGGSSLAREAAGQYGSWDPDETAGGGRNQYDFALAAIDDALRQRDIDGDGEADTLVPRGIAWMQGESDAGSQDTAGRYEANLARMMNLLRAAHRVDGLPVVIGRISDSGRDASDGKVWDHGEAVRSAQAAFVEADPAAALVTTTDEYGYSDGAHYDTAGYIDLGHEFAAAMDELMRAEAQRPVTHGR